MRDIDKLIGEIIPPADYKHRNGFTNTAIINTLNELEKEQVEKALINKLLCDTDNNTDTLIVETLACLKSEKSIPVLKKSLIKCSNKAGKIIIAASIYEINEDNEMIEVAADVFKQLDDKKDAYYVYGLIEAFYYMIKFKSPEVNKMVEKYINHPEFLLSYNARRALGKL